MTIIYTFVNFASKVLNRLWTFFLVCVRQNMESRCENNRWMLYMRLSRSYVDALHTRYDVWCMIIMMHHLFSVVLSHMHGKVYFILLTIVILCKCCFVVFLQSLPAYAPYVADWPKNFQNLINTPSELNGIVSNQPYYAYFINNNEIHWDDWFLWCFPSDFRREIKWNSLQFNSTLRCRFDNNNNRIFCKFEGPCEHADYENIHFDSMFSFWSKTIWAYIMRYTSYHMLIMCTVVCLRLLSTVFFRCCCWCCCDLTRRNFLSFFFT